MAELSVSGEPIFNLSTSVIFAVVCVKPFTVVFAGRLKGRFYDCNLLSLKLIRIELFLKKVILKSKMNK